MLDGRTIYTALLVLYVLAMLFGRKEQRWIFTALLVAGMAFVAFHAESIFDLNNYYAGQGYKASLGFLQFCKENLKNDEVLSSLWMWVCSKFRYLGVLPALTTAVFYASLCGLLFAVQKRVEAEDKYLLLAILFVLCTTKFYSVLAGVRNHMGFLAFALAAVSELLLEGKKWPCWLGYLAAVSFHNSLIVFLAVRLFLAFYRRCPNRMMMGLLLAGSLFGYQLVSLAAQLTGWTFLESMEQDASSYYGGEVTSHLSLGNLSTAIVKIICIALLIFYAYSLLQKGSLDRKYRNYLDLVSACLMVSIGGAFGSEHTLVRFPELLGLLAAPLLLAVLTTGEKAAPPRPPKTCIRVRRRQPVCYTLLYCVFYLDSGMFFGFQFLGTLTLIGWQTPALLVGGIR